MTIISPSILSADFANLASEIDLFNQSNAKWLHYDVMDGHFVPNISFGTDILKLCGKLTNKFVDVHIMVSNPSAVIEYFKDCRIDNLTFHYESCKNNDEVLKVINEIRSKGWKVGISVKPNTDIKLLEPILKEVDLVLVMSVEPGFGGQKFMPEMMQKGDWLFEFKNKNNLNYLIEIDGGINEETARIAIEHHFEVLVAGSYCFKHPAGLKKAVDNLLNI